MKPNRWSVTCKFCPKSFYPMTEGMTPNSSFFGYTWGKLTGNKTLKRWLIYHAPEGKAKRLKNGN
jgi:hypothetical protein